MIPHKLLTLRQSYPLEIKEAMSLLRIEQWIRKQGVNRVYIAFSGGKDSTVLLDLVRRVCPSVPAVFVDTGLEYPEIRQFVKTIDNVIWLRPKMSFREVLLRYGYPLTSKQTAAGIRKLTTQNLSERHRNKLLHGDERGTRGKIPERFKHLLDADFRVSEKCCDVLKERPRLNFERSCRKKGITGEMAIESLGREKEYLKTGCNAFNQGSPKSKPLSFWTDSDIWAYIKKYNIRYSAAYDMGYKRTGCMFCMFNVHNEEQPNRFQLMQKTHPKLWDYCINKLGIKKPLDAIGVRYEWNDDCEKVEQISLDDYMRQYEEVGV